MNYLLRRFKTTFRGSFSAQNASLFSPPVSRKNHHGCHLQFSLKDQKIHIGYIDTVMSKWHSVTTLGEERYKGQQMKTEPSLTPLPGHREHLCVVGYINGTADTQRKGNNATCCS